MFLQHVIEENDICNEIQAYLNYFDSETWKKYTGIDDFRLEYDSDGSRGFVPSSSLPINNISLALIICTYHRVSQIRKNIDKLLQMKFFNQKESDYYGHLHVYIVDNGSELNQVNNDYFTVIHNENSGGSGGFQRGLTEVRTSDNKYTHVIFMDDDADFLPETFYRLFSLLSYLKPEYRNRSVAGRMFCLDKPEIQYTAAEIWNSGELQHLGFMQDMTNPDLDSLNNSEVADYGGWWFCCYPYEFCMENDVIPFFLHCDDVEYGLRFMAAGGGRPIILNGIQVWHETAVYRQNPIIHYYDTRNPLFVNEKHGLICDYNNLYDNWFKKITEYHVNGDYASEYYTIIAMLDYLKGINYLYHINPGKKHALLAKAKISKYKNAILWRIVRKRYHALKARH